MRHVVVMTLTSSIGLMAVFFIDLLSMFYISMAHRDAWRAAVSLMSKVMFFPFALNMGMMIGVGTAVSVAVGRGDRERAGRMAAAGLLSSALLALVVSLLAWPFRVDILQLFGAEGEALGAAARLLSMVLPVNVLLAAGMASASILRAYGDPTRAMLVTLAGAVVTAAADPLCIFVLGKGIDGVGMAIVASRIAFLTVGLWGILHVHRIVRPPLPFPGRAEIRAIAEVAIPAMAANLALPFADWYVTRTIWQFGVKVSAAAGIFDRVMPLAFSLVFALTTALGPILGQNLGAKAYERVRRTFGCALAVVGLYGLVVWLVLAFAAPGLAEAFRLAGLTRTFFLFLCRYATIAWVFVAFLLVANAVFNTIGRAQLSTWFNWGRATLGTVPFVWLGARAGGPEQAMLGIVSAAIVFALASLGVAWNFMRHLDTASPAEPLRGRGLQGIDGRGESA